MNPPSSGNDACLRICIVGAGGVGKSCVTLRFLKDKFVDYYDPTIEEGYRKTLMVDGFEYNIEIVDTAGQEEFSSFRDNALDFGHGFILVLALNSTSSWEELAELHEKIKRIKNVERVPCVILANKCDVVDEILVSMDSVRDYAKSFEIPTFEVSAKTGYNINLGFHEIIRQIIIINPAIVARRDLTSGGISQAAASTTAASSKKDDEATNNKKNSPKESSCCILL